MRESGFDGGAEGAGAGGEVESRGGFEGVGERRVVGDQVDGFGPLLALERVGDGADEAAGDGFASVDDGRGFDRAALFDGGEHRVDVAGEIGGVELVEIEAFRFPVLVEADGEIEVRLVLEPADVGADFGGGEVLVVAVEVEAVGVFAGAVEEAGGVEERAEEPVGAGVEDTGLEHVEEREGTGGFVAVDAGGKVEARAGAGRAFGEGEERDAGDGAEVFDAELGGAGGVFETGDEVGGGEWRGGGARIHDREEKPRNTRNTRKGRLDGTSKNFRVFRVFRGFLVECLLFAFVLLPVPRVSFTSAVRARRCSTGFMRGTRAGRLCCGSRTRTRSGTASSSST